YGAACSVDTYASWSGGLQKRRARLSRESGRVNTRRCQNDFSRGADRYRLRTPFPPLEETFAGDPCTWKARSGPIECALSKRSYLNNSSTRGCVRCRLKSVRAQSSCSHPIASSLTG